MGAESLTRRPWAVTSDLRRRTAWFNGTLHTSHLILHSSYPTPYKLQLLTHLTFQISSRKARNSPNDSYHTTHTMYFVPHYISPQSHFKAHASHLVTHTINLTSCLTPLTTQPIAARTSHLIPHISWQHTSHFIPHILHLIQQTLCLQPNTPTQLSQSHSLSSSSFSPSLRLSLLSPSPFLPRLLLS